MHTIIYNYAKIGASGKMENSQVHLSKSSLISKIRLKRLQLATDRFSVNFSAEAR